MASLNRGSSRGFTLVELVLVMTIAGVLAAVMGPRMVDRTAFQTHGSAAEIRTALRYAQKLALAKNREVCVTTAAIPTPRLTLAFSLVPSGPCDQQVVRPDGGQNPDGSLDYLVIVPANITFTSNPAAFRFDGQGRPSPNGAVIPGVAVTPPGVVVAALEIGGTVSVTVRRETGYVQ